jgi:hypothetical protein
MPDFEDFGRKISKIWRKKPFGQFSPLDEKQSHTHSANLHELLRTLASATVYQSLRVERQKED